MSYTAHVYHAMALKDALSEAQSLGCEVSWHKGGEIIVKHPKFPRPVVLNSRKKAAPRALTVRLIQLIKRMTTKESS